MSRLALCIPTAHTFRSPLKLRLALILIADMCVFAPNLTSCSRQFSVSQHAFTHAPAPGTAVSLCREIVPYRHVACKWEHKRLDKRGLAQASLRGHAAHQIKGFTACQATTLPAGYKTGAAGAETVHDLSTISFCMLTLQTSKGFLRLWRPSVGCAAVVQCKTCSTLTSMCGQHMWPACHSESHTLGRCCRLQQKSWSHLGWWWWT